MLFDLFLGCSDDNRIPLSIPASPFMKKLGYGTGVNVYLMKRSVNEKIEKYFRSVS